MTQYEALDLVADNVTRVMALWLIGLALRDVIRGRWRTLFAFLACAVIVYGLAFLDARTGLWKRAGLDYSTHAAAATTLALALGWRQPRWRWAWWLLVCAYFGLMLLQRYHGLGDILTTAVCVALPMLLVFHRLRGPAPARVQQADPHGAG